MHGCPALPALWRVLSCVLCKTLARNHHCEFTAEGGKGEVWLDSGKEQVVLFSLVAFAVPQAMRAGETGS